MNMFEKNICVYDDKKNDIYIDEDMVEEYDEHGRLIKTCQVKNKKLNGLYLEKELDNNNNLIKSMMANYVDGILNGYYKLKKYENNKLIYIESSMYTNGLLEGNKEVKQYKNEKLIFHSIFFYVRGIKNGYFKICNNEELCEGTLKQSLYNGIITTITKNRKEIVVYEEGNLISIIEATIYINDKQISLVLTDDIKYVWRIGHVNGFQNTLVLVKCVINDYCKKQKYLTKLNYTKVDRCKIIEIYDDTGKFYDSYISTMNNDQGKHYYKGEILFNDVCVYANLDIALAENFI